MLSVTLYPEQLKSNVFMFRASKNCETLEIMVYRTGWEKHDFQ